MGSRLFHSCISCPIVDRLPPLRVDLSVYEILVILRAGHVSFPSGASASLVSTTSFRNSYNINTVFTKRTRRTLFFL